MSAGDDGGTLGLRARMAASLVAVLALAAVLALLAVRPLVSASQRAVRRRTAVALTRAVAGQVVHAQRGDLAALLGDSIGPGALEGAAVVDASGQVIASAGSRGGTAFAGAVPEDGVTETASRVTVTVTLPGGRAFVADVSLAPGAAERAASLAMLMYTAMASGAALLVVYVALTRTIVRPIEQLTRTAERVADGRRDPLPAPANRGARELVRVARAFHTMTAQLIAREKELSDRVLALERAGRELEQAQSQLVRSERLATVGRLAAGIAHEVGNPLAAIVGLADVIREGGLDDGEVRDFGGRIGAEAQRIHRTVRELLDYARAAPTRTNEPSAPLESAVAEAVAQVRKLLEPQPALRGLRWTVEVPAACKVALGADRLVQILLNLSLNAADATADRPDGAALTVRARRESSTVVLEVEDDGPGVPADLRARVFEPFYTTRPAGKGTGLGLAICAAIVEPAHGRISIVDRPDGARGACVRVELPAA